MPKVDFYLLNTAAQEESYRFLCRLVDKAYQQQQLAYVYTHSLTEAQHLDDLLWTFRDVSFIPHQIGETATLQSPVSIVMDQPKHLRNDLLFNLTQEVPHFLPECSRIIEIVSEEKSEKTQARKKYKAYQIQHCILTTHHIRLPC